MNEIPTDKLMADAINLGRKNLIEWQEYGQSLKSQLDAASAKLSERKTVHQWLNAKGTPREENGKPLCLLRRLAIALEIHDPQPTSKNFCPWCNFNGSSQPYGMNPEIHECPKCKGTWFDETAPTP